MKEFKNERAPIWRKAYSYLRTLNGYRQRAIFSDVDSWVLFIGYPRSGHTLIGSLIDAHPSAVIAHELDIIYYWKNKYSQAQVDYLLLKNAEQFTADGRQWMDYNYFVPGQWQGKHQGIKVMGDKSGGRTSRRLLLTDTYDHLEKAEQNTGRKIIFLHVIRNPYDIITTMMKRTAKRRHLTEDKTIFERKVRHFFQHAASVERLIEKDNYRIVDVYHEDFVADPRKELARICDQLALPSPEDYLAACSDLVWDKPRKSRHGTNLWTAEQIDFVKQEMSIYPWFDRYHF